MFRRYEDKVKTGINAAAASIAAGNIIQVKNAKKITAIFTRAGHASGSGLFEIYGSIDGATFVALPLTEFVANTNSQTLTRELSTSLASSSSVLRAVEELFCGVNFIYVKYTKTTDGTGTAELMIDDDLMS